MFFYGRRKKWKNGPHSYVTHLHQPPATVRLIMSHRVSAGCERAMLAQLPARRLLSPSLRRRVKKKNNMLTWRPAVLSLREGGRGGGKGKKKKKTSGDSEASGATMNSADEELGYSSSLRRQIASSVSVATRRGQRWREGDLICATAIGPLRCHFYQSIPSTTHLSRFPASSSSQT